MNVIMNVPSQPVICAIDTPDCARAVDSVKEIAPEVGAIKLGLEFFTHNGAEGVRRVAACGAPIFLDLKFHDIPNTVHGAVLSAARLGVFMLTVHTSGGMAMMQAASEAAGEISRSMGGVRPKIIGVTVLTSLDDEDLKQTGVSASAADQALRLATLAQKAGLDGVVCSAHEITRIREACGSDFTLVAPGIRPFGSEIGDQKRVLTPREALASGADYLVIGRPITGAANPLKAAREIRLSLL